MDELLAKLTNLGYEFTGIFLPGVVGVLFFLLWWAGLGPMASIWSGGAVPAFSVETARAIIDSLHAASGIGVAIPLIMLCYFVGHLLHWTARSGVSDQAVVDTWYKSLAYSLLFRIPKPAAPFNPKLQALFEAVRSKFSHDHRALEWREFYPLAKTYLARAAKKSLASVYQNKYTLHRSITAAAALLFWASLVVIGVSIIFGAEFMQSPNYLLLSFLAMSALVLVRGFSASYIYNWEMWGNTLVTETYSEIYEPKHD
ncbi:MAG: hypothetical protein ACYDHM_01995 [Acidiferrobacterales bacterium]